MGNVSVQKTSEGFIVTRGADTITVVDKNKNGRIDSSDVWNLAGKEPLTQEELWEAIGLSLAKQDMSTEEMKQYEAFLKQRELYAKQKEEQQQQIESQNNKKGNFWNKLLTGCQILMPVLSMTSGFIGVLGSFGFNNNAADKAIKWNTAMNTLQMGASSIAAYSMLSNLNNNFNFNNALSGFNFTQNNLDLNTMLQNAMTIQATNTQKQQEAWTQQIATSNNTKARNKVNELLENKETNGLAPQNETAIADLQDLDETKTYTKAELAKISQIGLTPRIPVNHIDTAETKSETKLSPAFAQKIEAKLREYDSANGDLKYDVMSQEQYITIKTILAKSSLEKTDITNLKEIYNKITQKTED